MVENHMGEVAKMLGIEMNKPFNVVNKDGKSIPSNPYILKEHGLYDGNDDLRAGTLLRLLRGTYGIERSILDDAEKRYLENILRPFKDRVILIIKRRKRFFDSCCDYIFIAYKEIEGCGISDISFPYFHIDTMYKGMEANRGYTIEELGLFQDREGD